MRFILISFFLLVTLVSAKETERIESIVEDISNLRNSYVKVRNELKDEKEKSSKYNKRIKYLENEILSLKKELKTKEKSFKISKINSTTKSKNQIKQKICLKKEIKEEGNIFPSLVLKNKFQKKNDKKLHYFKASTFRVKKLAYIYDSIDGNVVDEWEELRSFTSNQKSDDWIKITGYFVNQIWIPSEVSLWIESKDAKMRTK